MVLSYHPQIYSESRVVATPATDYNEQIKRVAENRDRVAFEKIFSHFAPKIKAILMKQGSNPEQAEDLMQETLLTVWNKAEQFAQTRGSLNAWIFTIARNKRIDRFRKQGTNHYVDIHEYEIEDDIPDIEDQILSSERDQIVAEATNCLPEDQKLIITMSFVQDLTQTQIAEKLGIPLGTVKSRMRLAYQKVKIKLENAL